jgi:hypothetical protein
MVECIKEGLDEIDGLALGRALGRVLGWALGRALGRVQGRALGLSVGIQLGRSTYTLLFALAMLCNDKSKRVDRHNRQK